MTALITRDTSFYRATGDTTVLVENTLFRVHRFVLTEVEDSAFKDMFSIPQSVKIDGVTEGSDDEHPIVLVGDGAEEFRALCKVLYLPAWKVSTLNRKEDLNLSVGELMSLTSATTKYGFRDLGTWAMGRLEQKFFSAEAKPSSISAFGASGTTTKVYSMTCSETLLEKFLYLCAKADRSDLLKQIGDCWFTRLKNDYRCNIRIALNAAENLGCTRFIGQVYYIAAVRTSSNSQAQSNLQALPSICYPTGLSVEQQVKIKNGLVKLSILSDQIFYNKLCTPSDFPHKTLGSLFGPQFTSVDILGKLEHVIKLRSPAAGTAIGTPSPNKLQEIHDFHLQNLHLYFIDNDPIVKKGTLE